MVFSTRFALAALCASSFVLGAPVAEPEGALLFGRAVYSVSQVANPDFKKSQISGFKALKKTYAKFNVKLPADILAATQSGSVVATPADAYDSEYLCPVQIGTPAQTLNLDFDTGSADLWVFSSETPSTQSGKHNLYKVASSSTSSKLTGSTWAITYGDGSGAKGDVYKDKVVVGGATVTSQAVEAAQSVSSSFSSDTNDGLLGLSFGSLNTVSPTKQLTFFDNLKSSLASPLFTVDLKYHAAGKYNFGYIEAGAYTGAIAYSNVNTANGFWEITSTGYAVGTGSFVSSSIDAIVDTGTTLLYLPTAIVTAYYAKVTGAAYSSAAGGYTFPCTATLPSFTFGVGTYRGVIPGKFMNYAPYSGSSCYGGIQRNTGIGFSIFGDILLKSQFVVFNGAATPQVGFAAKTLPAH